ncbi:hypothetical protein ACTXIR_12115 [Psychrobacter glacincola]|jgi:hypothetical protein|uniref:hypothetical protein n=1 Tax=Psychrobacter glacincola TaxID=56810 RepID=UPI003FD02459
MKSGKQSIDNNSSAEHVEQHLQELEKADYELLYYSQEQSFSSDEMTRLVNEERLNELMAQSDAFLRGLNDGIKDFDKSTGN